GPGLPIYIYHRVFESLPTTVRFEDVFELNRFVLKLAQVSGSHISVLDPITDATLPDGSRLNLTYGTEVTRKGSSFTIRKFTEEPVSPIELLDYGSVSTELLAYLWLLLEYGKSILVSGGTATGKTTLLNAILLFIKPEDKIVSVEDTAEINIPHDNWIQSVTRSGFGRASSANVSGVSGKVGDIGLYNLVMAALRQRPDYIIVGEVRGSEAFTMFQAISVGHAVMGTIHAGTMQELINRVESPPMNVPRVLLAGLDLVIFAGRILRSDGHIRRVTKAVEVLGFESDELITNDIFRWNAYEDEFEYEGSSYLLERISEEFGIEYKYLVNELEERSRLINEMQCDKITNFRDVSRCIRSYQSSIKNKR
ncbi:MAG: type II/IV secretion system ATPase subunit, partial [Candidatus Syntropharchaeales archaeon]